MNAYDRWLGVLPRNERVGLREGFEAGRHVALCKVKRWVKKEMVEIPGPNCTSQDVVFAEYLQDELDKMIGAIKKEQ